jgi:RNA polymerase sigma-B factor
MGRSPSVAELAAALHAPEEDVLEALQAGFAYHASSLDAQRGEDDNDAFTLCDVLGGDDEGYRLAEQRALLESVLCELTDRDRLILRLRFEEDMTQTEIACVVGVSQMQVSRLIRRSLAAMRIAAERRPSHADGFAALSTREPEHAMIAS